MPFWLKETLLTFNRDIRSNATYVGYITVHFEVQATSKYKIKYEECGEERKIDKKFIKMLDCE